VRGARARRVLVGQWADLNVFVVVSLASDKRIQARDIKRFGKKTPEKKKEEIPPRECCVPSRYVWSSCMCGCEEAEAEEEGEA
jgi:hypothetical protein